MSKAKVDQARAHVGEAVRRIPQAHPSRLLIRLVPESSDGDESGWDGALSQTEEDPLHEEARVVVADDGEEADEAPDEDADGAGFGEGVSREDQGPRQDGYDVSVVVLPSATEWDER